MKRVVFLAAVTLILTACAAPAPTIDAAQVQASAMAAAATMIAETQAAAPTNTPVPPTPLSSPTPFPSPTLLAFGSTLSAFASPTSSSSGASDCNHPLDVGSAGATTTVLINNNTKGPVTFSIGLGSRNSFGECGYVGWSIPKGQSVSASVPQTRTNQGDPCYWAYAWINDPRHSTTVSGGGFCLNNPDKWTFDIGYDKIKLTPP